MVLRTLRAALVVAAISLAIPTAANAASFNFPLEGWWSLNEGSGQTVRDWSGNNNHGYLGLTPAVDAADPIWVNDGIWGSALRFINDDRVTIPANSELEPQRLTVSAWVRWKPEAPLGGPTPGIFKFPLSMGGDACRISSYGMFTDVNEGLVFYIGSTSGQTITSPAAPRTIWDGKWHHVAGTFDGSKVRFYLDGVQQGNGTAVPAGTTIDYSFATQSGAIGDYSGECGESLAMQGDIDGVQIWSTPVPVDTIWRFLKSLFASR